MPQREVDGMNRKVVSGALGTVILAAGAAITETAVGRRASRKLARRLMGELRHQVGLLAGARYRIGGHHPDPNVCDGVLADRVSSTLGPLEHHLDIPRVRVRAEGHEVHLYGRVTSQAQADMIVSAVREISGVHGVVSDLHIGLLPGDTRPSQGTANPPPSVALTTMLSAARDGGAREGAERACVRSVLSTFMALLPEGERRHVLTHLPNDLCMVAEPLRPRWAGIAHPRRLDKFVIAALPNVDPQCRESVVISVIGALRNLVPEESVDVAAVLPKGLRALWGERPSSTRAPEGVE